MALADADGIESLPCASSVRPSGSGHVALQPGGQHERHVAEFTFEHECESTDSSMGRVELEVADMEPGLITVDVVGDHPRRMDADDLRREEMIGGARVDDRGGEATNLEEMRPLHRLLSHLV